MKVFTKILKVFAVLAAIAGVIYVVATYGDKIVAWAKSLLAKFDCCCCGCDCDCDCDCDSDCDCCEDEVAEVNDKDFEG